VFILAGTSDIYKKLGVTKMINAAGTYTVIGGSRMTEETLESMRLASRHFVDIRELQKKVHERIAKISKNEAAYVATGAAASLYLATAAAIVLKYDRPFVYLSKENIEKTEIIIQRSHRNPYDWGVRQLGAKLHEIGYPNVIQPTSPEDLEYAINDHTAAIFYAAMPGGGWTAAGELDFEQTLQIAEKHKIPVIVDAAAQLPPVDNLWNFTSAGAAAAIFSGGKDLRGPQASGLTVGKKYLLDKMIEVGFPNYGIGRMLKVGREEMCGLLSAVEQYVSMNHDTRREKCEKEVMAIIEYFADYNSISVTRSFPNEAGQPVPQALLKIDAPFDSPAQVLSKNLRIGEPGIAVAVNNPDSFFVNPMTLDEGELKMVLKKLKDVFYELGIN